MKKWLIGGVLLVLGAGCKPQTNNPNPTNAPASFVYTDPRNGQQITVINDGTSNNPFLGIAYMTQALESLPLSQLQGITTLRYSDWVQEIADNIYDNLSSSDQAAWNAVVAPKAAADNETPLQEFENLYSRYIIEPSIGNLDAFTSALQQGDTATATEWLFLMSQFVDLSNHEIIGYVGSPMYSSGINFLLVPQFFGVNGNLLTIGPTQFNLGVINGQPAITGINGKGLGTLFILPSIFLNSIGTPAVAPADQAQAAASEALRQGQMLTTPSMGTSYESPISPNVYRPVTAKGVENDLGLEIQGLQNNPQSAFLKGQISAADHGFLASSSNH